MYGQGAVPDAMASHAKARVRRKSCTLHWHFCSAALTQRLLLNQRTDRPILDLLSRTISIAQADALAKRQARVDAQRVRSKLKRQGLASLTTDDITVILKQAYGAGWGVSLEGCNAA